MAPHKNVVEVFLLCMWIIWHVYTTATISVCTVLAIMYIVCSVSGTNGDWNKHCQVGWSVRSRFPQITLVWGLHGLAQTSAQGDTCWHGYTSHIGTFFVTVLHDKLKRWWLWMVHFGVETDCTKQAISYKRSGYLTTIVVVLQFGNMGWSTTRV